MDESARRGLGAGDSSGSGSRRGKSFEEVTDTMALQLTMSLEVRGRAHTSGRSLHVFT
jgi:hypothetical protein